MGSESDTNCMVIIIVFMVLSSLLSSTIAGLNNYDPDALDAVFLSYANQTLAKHKGTLRKVELPSNFSGMEVSTVRMRGGSLRERGINLNYIKIPPRVKISIHVKRVVIVSYNLGNWSSKYHEVPGYTLVSPVLGFDIYDYSNLTTSMDKMLNLSTLREPISIHFPYIEGENVTEPICVKFGAGDSVEFKNMTMGNVCLTGESGHFSVAVSSSTEKKVKRIWKWWVVGLVCATGGLLMLALLVVKVPVLLRRMKIKAMEKESDRAEALHTFWVGGNRMPCASMIRTQPVLEHDYVP